MTQLLAALGHPEAKLPPVIHVAGTNGKGSTVAFLRACLEASGKRVHVYISPHLVRFAERIRLAGKLIDEEALVAVLDECERVNGGAPITFFEITTAAAFLAFSRVPADFVLLEVGLGGRFDATNVVPQPVVTAITPVSLDHQQFLGNTVAEIAFEKAGILKPRTPAVITRQPEAAATVITARAREIGAPLFRQGAEWEAERRADGGLSYRGRHSFELPPPGLIGPHQYDNAGAALACLDSIPDLALTQPDLAQGLRQVEWPARLQHLGHGALAQLMPAGAELWLDGGHNPAGGAALAEMVKGWRDKPLRLVFGMLKTHDAIGFLKPLAPLAQRLDAVTIPGEANSLTAEETVAAARAVGLEATPRASIAAAIAAAAIPQTRVLICGSLYLAGRVLAENGTPP